MNLEPKEPRELTEKELVAEAAGVQKGIFDAILMSRLATDKYAPVVIQLMLTAASSMALHKGYGRKMFLNACREIFLNAEKQIQSMNQARADMACATAPNANGEDK